MVLGQPRDDVVVNIKVQIKEAKARLREFEKRTTNMANKTGMAYKKGLQKHMMGVEVAQKRLNKELNRGKFEFQGWALSIMFMGMAMTNVFKSVWRESSKTFNDVMHSVDGAVTGFDILSGSLTYLGFVLGQALEPVAEFLAPIVDWLSRLISENEALARNFLLTFGAGGILLQGIGFLTLGFMGLFEAVSKLKASAFFVALANPVVASTIAGLILLAGLSWKSFNETPKAWKALQESAEIIASAFTDSLIPAINSLIQTIFPNFQVSWENIAWTIAYIIEAIAVRIKGLADFFSLIINLVTLSIKTVKAFWDAVSGNDVAVVSFENQREELKRQIDSNLAGIRSGILANFNMQTIDEYRRQKLTESATGVNPFRPDPTIQSVPMQNATPVTVYLDGEVIFSRALDEVNRG